MSRGEDLTAEALAPILGERAVRTHPVLLSTSVSALQWAGEGAPDGAVVVADSQIAAHGRAGRPWKVTSGQGLAFALVMRPQLPAAREGWLYTVVLTSLADVCGDGVTIAWPDEVRRDDVMAAAVGIEIRLGSRGVKWAVANVLIADAQPPRGPLLGSVLEAIDARRASSPSAVLDDYAPLCRTLGRSVRVRLLGGTGRLQGKAVDTRDDGTLVVEKETGAQVPVQPQHVSSLEEM